jgi:hypothetical protein
MSSNGLCCLTRAKMLAGIERTAKAVAAMSDAPAPDIQIIEGTKAVINDPVHGDPKISLRDDSEEWRSSGRLRGRQTSSTRARVRGFAARDAG